MQGYIVPTTLQQLNATAAAAAATTGDARASSRAQSASSASHGFVTPSVVGVDEVREAACFGL